MLPVNIQVIQTTNIKTGSNQFNFMSTQNYIIFNIWTSAKDPDPQDFGFLDLDLQKYVVSRIRIQGAKYQPKTEKEIFLLLKSKSELLKNKRL